MLEDNLQAISQDNNGFPPLHNVGYSCARESSIFQTFRLGQKRTNSQTEKIHKIYIG